MDMNTCANDEEQNHAESFADLYKTYSQKIFNLAYRMTGNKEDAADITQDTFIQVFSSVETFRGDSQLYTWIFAIAKNQCYKLYKCQKRNVFISFENLIRDAAAAKIETKFSELDKQNLIDQVKEGCLTGLLGCLSFYQRIGFTYISY